MICPFCSAGDTQVVDSRVNDEGDSVRRRCRCSSCDKRFTTYETADLRLPQVIKGNGNRDDFKDKKLREGFFLALHKRPVSTESMEEALQRIRSTMLVLGEREVSSRQIGELVMAELRKLDKVAYIRFASVYRSFQDVDDFRDALKDLK
jgi:transcriptional repressor NrdR